MNIKINALLPLSIRPKVVDNNDLADLQYGSAEVRFPRADRFPMGLDATAQYEPASRSRDFMSFIIGGCYYCTPIDRFDIVTTIEDENHYRFSEIGLHYTGTQSVTIIIPYNEEDAIIALSDSVRLNNDGHALSHTFDICVARFNPTGVVFQTVYLRGCRVTSIETSEGCPAKFIIDVQAIFYV